MPIHEHKDGEPEFPNVSCSVTCKCRQKISMRNYGASHISVSCWKCPRWIDFYITTSGGVRAFISGPNEPPTETIPYNMWVERKKKR